MNHPRPLVSLHAHSTMADRDEIIELEVGWSKVENDGVKPFLNLIEEGKRDFYKADEFVALYEYVLTHITHLHTLVRFRLHCTTIPYAQTR